MRIFEEKQRFTGWWFVGLISIVMVITIDGFYNDFVKEINTDPIDFNSHIIPLFVVACLSLLIFLLKLKIRIAKYGRELLYVTQKKEKVNQVLISYMSKLNSYAEL